MDIVYVELNWQGAGYYRSRRFYKSSDTDYRILDRICDLNDDDRVQIERTRKTRLFRAEKIDDLPKAK